MKMNSKQFDKIFDKAARNQGIYDTRKYRYIAGTSITKMRRALIAELGTTACQFETVERKDQ